MGKGRTGFSSLSYTGVEPSNPPLFLTHTYDPTNDFEKNFNIGTLWLNETTQVLWMLVRVLGKVATWIPFGSAAIGNGLNGQLLIAGLGGPQWQYLTSPGGTIAITYPGLNQINLEVGTGFGTTQFDADVGFAVPTAGGVIDILGGANTGTTGAGNVVTVNMDDDVVIPTTLTISTLGAGVVQTDAAGLFFSDNGLNGQVLIGGGTEPNWNYITSAGGTIAITYPGPNQINIESLGVGVSSKFLYAQDLGTVVNATGDGTVYFLGSGANGILSMIFDDNADVYPGDGAGNCAYFTAPQDGKYYFGVSVWAGNPAGLPYLFSYSSEGGINVITTARTYVLKNPPYQCDVNSGIIAKTDESKFFDVIADMAMGDTVFFSFSMDSVTGPPIKPKTIGILPGQTYIYGYLII